MFGDVESRHNFDSRDDGELVGRGNFVYHLADTIDAVAHAQGEFAQPRFEMDVRYLFLVSIDEDFIDQADNLRIAFGKLGVIRLFVFHDSAVGKFADQLAHLAVGSEIVIFDGFLNLVAA